MKRGIIVALILLFAGVGVWAQAEFTEVNGKVEIRPVAGGAWQPAEVGMRINRNTMISTGFNASAALQVSDSTVRVEQLTRMAFEEIVEQSDSVQTRLNLNVGRVRAQVRSTDGRSQDFRVRSPLSTAAVRGTDFSFDGARLEVAEGQVAFVNAYGQERLVSGGQQSQTSGEPGTPTSPGEEAEEASGTSINPLGAGGDEADEGDDGGSRGRSTRGTIVIEIQ